MTNRDQIQGHFRALPGGWTPQGALAVWPRSEPLAVLWSGAPVDPAQRRWSRWTILARPTRTVHIEAAGGDPLVRLHEVLTSTASSTEPGVGDSPPFAGGWIVALSYELGRIIEPAAGAAHPPPRTAWPLITMVRCPEAYIHDGLTSRWWGVSAPDALHRLPDLDPDLASPRHEPGYTLGPLGQAPRGAFQNSVARTVEYTHAGDIFQANVSHEIAGRFHGSSRALFGALCDRAAPWYGAYLENRRPDGAARAVASASPELFLELDARTRTVVTRPIKGTRRAAASARELETSSKDQAELNMIVDLMRNDLGRVCDFGSVHVTQPRTIERHAVQHGVATVQGTLRAGLNVADLLRATFPGGSVTGAPKIRAMQIIDELERSPRGIYTGAIGYVSDCGNACFNVAIRTASIEGRLATGSLHEFEKAELTYRVGAGIVADSDPALEWQETLDKASILLDLADRPKGAPDSHPADRLRVRRQRVHGAPA